MKNKIKCRTCVHKFECLAKHHIPENYGNDCPEYEENKTMCSDIFTAVAEG